MGYLFEKKSVYSMKPESGGEKVFYDLVEEMFSKEISDLSPEAFNNLTDEIKETIHKVDSLLELCNPRKIEYNNENVDDNTEQKYFISKFAELKDKLGDHPWCITETENNQYYYQVYLDEIYKFINDSIELIKDNEISNSKIITIKKNISDSYDVIKDCHTKRVSSLLGAITSKENLLKSFGEISEERKKFTIVNNLINGINRELVTHELENNHISYEYIGNIYKYLNSFEAIKSVIEKMEFFEEYINLQGEFDKITHNENEKKLRRRDELNKIKENLPNPKQHPWKCMFVAMNIKGTLDETLRNLIDHILFSYDKSNHYQLCNLLQQHYLKIFLLLKNVPVNKKHTKYESIDLDTYILLRECISDIEFLSSSITDTNIKEEKMIEIIVRVHDMDQGITKFIDESILNDIDVFKLDNDNKSNISIKDIIIKCYGRQAIYNIITKCTKKELTKKQQGTILTKISSGNFDRNIEKILSIGKEYPNPEKKNSSLNKYIEYWEMQKKLSETVLTETDVLNKVLSYK